LLLRLHHLDELLVLLKDLRDDAGVNLRGCCTWHGRGSRRLVVSILLRHL